LNEKEFFKLIGNETRRDILRSIAQEPKYLFKLSQELNKSQQMLQRHLKCLLDQGWLTYEINDEESKGPARKLYRIAKNVSVKITLSHHSFEFDVFEITIGKADLKSALPLNIIENLSKDLSMNLMQTLDNQNIRFDEQIHQLDQVLEKLESIENIVLSRKLKITGELNDQILVKLKGDAHRKDRELAYTIFSSSAPIEIDLIEKEINTKRTEILASLKRLRKKNLLPQKGIELINKIETNEQRVKIS
jgi:predicted transcriptional regulator